MAKRCGGETACDTCEHNLFGTCVNVVCDRCGTDAHYVTCEDYEEATDNECTRNV